MQVHVETYRGYGGVEVPRRFCLDGREIEAVETLDQWFGRSDRYYKVRGADASIYILRFDEIQADWQLIMFQSPEAQAEVRTTRRRPSPNGFDVSE